MPQEYSLEKEQLLEDPIEIIWDMTGMINHIMSGQLPDTSVNVEGVIIEFEPGSIVSPKDNITGFELTKFRETGVPAKKRKGLKKEGIKLNDDEYIGEFVSILYDQEICVLAVQSNKYGVTINQIDKYFGYLRLKYLEVIGKKENEDKRYIVKLKTIIDSNQIEKALEADYIRKLRFKCADFMMDAIPNKNNEIVKMRNSVGIAKGINFEIILIWY